MRCEKKTAAFNLYPEAAYAIAVKKERKGTAKISNHRRALYRVHQSHSVYGPVGRDVMNRSTTHSTVFA